MQHETEYRKLAAIMFTDMVGYSADAARRARRLYAAMGATARVERLFDEH